MAAVLAGIGLLALALSELAQVTWGDAVGWLIVAAIVALEGWSAAPGVPLKLMLYSLPEGLTRRSATA